MTDEDTEIDVERTESTSRETDGRSAVIDIDGYYKAQVWGDPDDDFDDVMEQLEAAADRAMEDIKHLEELTEGDGRTFG